MLKRRGFVTPSRTSDPRVSYIRHGLPRRIVTLIYVCWTLSTLAIAGYGLGESLWQLIIPCIAFNLLESVGTIGWMTLKQRHVPPGLLGRVSSLDWLISIGLVPLADHT